MTSLITIENSNSVWHPPTPFLNHQTREHTDSERLRFFLFAPPNLSFNPPVLLIQTLFDSRRSTMMSYQPWMTSLMNSNVTSPFPMNSPYPNGFPTPLIFSPNTTFNFCISDNSNYTSDTSTSTISTPKSSPNVPEPKTPFFDFSNCEEYVMFYSFIFYLLFSFFIILAHPAEAIKI